MKGYLSQDRSNVQVRVISMYRPYLPSVLGVTDRLSVQGLLRAGSGEEGTAPESIELSRAPGDSSDFSALLPGDMVSGRDSAEGATDPFASAAWSAALTRND